MFRTTLERVGVYQSLGAGKHMPLPGYVSPLVHEPHPSDGVQLQRPPLRPPPAQVHHHLHQIVVQYAHVCTHLTLVSARLRLCELAPLLGNAEVTLHTLTRHRTHNGQFNSASPRP